MRLVLSSSHLCIILVVLGPILAGRVSLAQMPDNMTIVVSSGQATGGAAVGAFGYDPLSDTLYVAGYGSGGELRRIHDVSGSQSWTQMVSPTQWALFMLDGNPTWYGGQYVPGGLLLNPQPIYAADGVTVLFPPYSQAWIIDATANIFETPWFTRRDDLTRKIYRYDLQQVQPPPNPKPPPPPYYDGRDVFTSLVTEADLQIALGIPVNTGGNDNLGRQFAWSSDGQSLYFNDSQTTYGGIWKVNARTGQLTLIYANMDADSANRINTEPGVIHTSLRDFDPGNPIEGDQILFKGTPLTGNPGGIDYLLDDGLAVHGPYALITQEQIEQVLEWNGRHNPREQNPDGSDPGLNPDGTPRISAITTDAEGNIYFFEQDTQSVWRLDTQGRLAGIKSKDQHEQFNFAAGSTSTNAMTLRMQVREAAYGTFTVPQILFQAVGPRAVGGIYVFKTGDFDRDNDLDDDDVNLFLAALAVPVETFSYVSFSKTYYYEAPSDGAGTELKIANPAGFVNYLKFDLNNNGLVTPRDRRMLWRFLGLAPCDYDRDGDVDQGDYGVLQACYTGADTPVTDPACLIAPLDDDDDVDRDDVDIFEQCRSGPALPATPDCADSLGV